MKALRMTVLILVPICACIILHPMCVKVSDEDWAHSESANSLHQLYLAVQTYHQVNGGMPPSAILGKNGKPLLSWRVLLLPYVEEDQYFREFHLDEPWDSPHNHPLLEKMPRIFSNVMDKESSMTHYQVLVGPGTPFEKEGLTWDDFSDGRSNTILIVDAMDGVPWTKPVDLHYDPAVSMGTLGRFHHKSIHFWGYTIGSHQVFNAVFADGSVHSIRKGKDPESLRGFITRNGAEPLDWSYVD
jgi:hypothetical protein